MPPLSEGLHLRLHGGHFINCGEPQDPITAQCVVMWELWFLEEASVPQPPGCVPHVERLAQREHKPRPPGSVGRLLSSHPGRSTGQPLDRGVGETQDC